MFKREMKVNFKNFLIWTLILIGIFLIVYLMYPSIMGSENASKINEMLEFFPKEVLVALNMDIASLDSAFGWLKSEGFVFVLLLTGIFSATLGTTILLKEESDKTIEYLNSLPIKRNDILIKKVLCGIIYIVLMIFILGIFNYIGLSLSGVFDKKLFILLSITPLFTSIVIFMLCLFISTFTHKTKKMTGISLGLVFLSYILSVFSEMGSSVEFLKYFSIFTLADIRNVIINSDINIVMIILTISIFLVLFILTMIRYNKKELV